MCACARVRARRVKQVTICNGVDQAYRSRRGMCQSSRLIAQGRAICGIDNFRIVVWKRQLSGDISKRRGLRSRLVGGGLESLKQWFNDDEESAKFAMPS